VRPRRRNKLIAPVYPVVLLRKSGGSPGLFFAQEKVFSHEKSVGLRKACQGLEYALQRENRRAEHGIAVEKCRAVVFSFSGRDVDVGVAKKTERALEELQPFLA